MCNKMYFKDRKAAQKYISMMDFRKTGDNRRSKKSNTVMKGKSFRPYDCRMCDGWHLTTQSKAKSRRIQKQRDINNS